MNGMCRYIADLFGSRHAGAIHGRVLTAWSAAALIGPNMLGFLRKGSHESAIRDLTAAVSEEGGDNRGRWEGARGGVR
jgi:hypothetical protein